MKRRRWKERQKKKRKKIEKITRPDQDTRSALNVTSVICCNIEAAFFLEIRLLYTREVISRKMLHSFSHQWPDNMALD